MQIFQRESLINLEDLRLELTHSLCIATILGGSFLAYEALLRFDFPWIAFAFYLFLVLVALYVRKLPETKAHLARRLLVGTMTACLLAAMALFPDPEIPYLGILLTFISAVLITRGEWIIPIIICGCAFGMNYFGWRTYSLNNLGVFMALGGIIAHLIFSTIHTALKWAWNAEIEAGQLLEQTRTHRAELSRSLKSLELTNLVQRRLQNELIAAKKEADAARQMKERFAANISHELRTPLNLILGFSDIMFFTPEAYGPFTWPPKLRRDIYQIHRSSKHLLEMIDDILDLSRYDMVDFTLHREMTPIDSLLKNTIEITSGLFENPEVNLELEMAPDLPVLEVDRTRIRQVIINLINNARRFTTQGYVRLQAGQNDKEVIICVSDSGPGIPADELDSIFNEFYQVDVSIRRKEQGFGLGLTICKRFVEAHRGRIWVESQVGEGSKFYFSLPKSRPLLMDFYQPIDYPLEQQQRSNILVVDPDPAVAALLARHLENADIIQVEKIEQLATQVMAHHPSAVIHNVHEDHPALPSTLNLPVPMIECSLPSQSWMARDLNVSAVLTKPITHEKLVHEIEKIKDAHEILIIDDSVEFVQLIRRILESTNQNYTIRQAYDGVQGLAALNEHVPDLILLDLIMPELDGAQFLREMRQKREFDPARVIILTATSYQSFSNIAPAGNLVVRQQHPLSVNEIAACIQAVLGILKPHYDEKSV